MKFTLPFISKPGHTAGFTFIELMVVIVIIGMLSIAGMVSFQRAGYSARNAKREADMSTIQQALALYKADNGVYPGENESSLEAMAENYLEMLTELQAGSYLSEALQDPKFESISQALGEENRKYMYDRETASTYRLYYIKEPGLTPSTKSNP